MRCYRYAQKDDVLDLAAEMPGARVKLRGAGQASAVLPWHFALTIECNGAT